jgi:multiple sugar transport system substrate-binding protein
MRRRVTVRAGLGVLCVASGAGVVASAGGPVAQAASPITINVTLADGPVPASTWEPFEKATGIHVNYTNIDWSDLQDKIAAAGEAHTYFADVTDVDWSKTGEYTATGWFEPLNKYFDVKSLKANFPAMGAFINSNGDFYGIPADSQFLVTTINTKDFKAAGITQIPTTIAQYTKDLETIKAKGVVAHPLGIPLAAGEYLSTYFYELTNAYGGTPLTCKYQPTFASPSSAGYKAVAWIVNAYKTGLAAKGDIDNIDTEEQTLTAHNEDASVFSDYSGEILSAYDNKAQSKVVGDIEYIRTPGLDGPAYNFTDPDGIGVPVGAKYPAAAIKFIQWMTSPQGQVDVAAQVGIPGNAQADSAYEKAFPGVEQNVLDTFAKSYARPVFPCGAPPWYPAFSQGIYTNIHEAAAGRETVAQAVHSMYSNAESLLKG